MADATVALYLHFPFCRSKCAYCDFCSHVPRGGEMGAYLAALREEIRRQAPRVAGRTVASVYLGGGTPTLYPAADLAGVLECLREHYRLGAEAEITCEANPGTVDTACLRTLRAAGVNRLSLGVQSFRAEELSLLGRGHSAAQAREAAAAARQAGIDNLSLDLISGLPGQSVADWEQSLREALALAPEHLSCYGLSLSLETPLGRRWERGELVSCPESVSVRQWRLTHRLLTAAGYRHYEISNYARPGRECRHNLTYWRNGEYLGLGAAAAGYLGGCRWANTDDTARYAARLAQGRSPQAEAEYPSPAQRLGERLMLGLRTSAGVKVAQLQEEFGAVAVAALEPLAEQMRQARLLRADRRAWRPTLRGMLLSNLLAGAFLEAATAPDRSGRG